LDLLAPGRQSLAAEYYEVIVTDDGSRSCAREMLAQSYPWAKWAEGPKRGPAANRNNGAKYAQGSWLVFTDDDCLPADGWLAAYYEAAKPSDVSVLEGKTAPTGVHLRVDMECPANEHGGYLWSCNMAIKREVFNGIGGFDLRFPGPCLEDVDLRVRLRALDIEVKFIPEALVLHPWRPRRGLEFCRARGRSEVYFLKKHPALASMFSIRALSTNLARKLIKQTPPVVWRCRGRGLVRDLALTFYASYVSFALHHWRKP
jgi:GT2 family glycosyltransferase